MIVTKRTRGAAPWLVAGVLGLAVAGAMSSVQADEPMDTRGKEPAAKEAPKAKAASFPWTPDLKTALAEARKKAEKKQVSGLVLVTVLNGQCLYCDQLDKELFLDKKVVAATERFPFVREKVGGDELGVVHDSAFAKEQKTPFTPTFYLVDGSGKVIDKFYGLNTPDELLARLEKGEKDNQAFPKLEAHVNEHPEDLDAVGRYAAALAARGRVNEAIALVKKAEGDKEGPKAALAPAYNRIGDTYYEAVWKQMCELHGSFEAYDKRSFEAANWFRKTIETSKDPEHLAYARYGLATCFGVAWKSEEQRVELFKEILAMPDAPELLKSRIERGWKLTRPGKATKDK